MARDSNMGALGKGPVVGVNTGQWASPGQHLDQAWPPVALPLCITRTSLDFLQSLLTSSCASAQFPSGPCFSVCSFSQHSSVCTQEGLVGHNSFPVGSLGPGCRCPEEPRRAPMLEEGGKAGEWAPSLPAAPPSARTGQLSELMTRVVSQKCGSPVFS